MATKIQFRRDTSENWTQANPIPASAEPCFETDTGKLKFGDGTTSYNDLDYFGSQSVPVATESSLGIVQPDGTTITISNGILSANVSGEGGGGTSDYSALSNKPQINSVLLEGNVSLDSLGVQPAGDYALSSSVPQSLSDLTNDSGFITKDINDLTNYTLTSALAAVATTGSYNDLTDKPNIAGKYVLPTASTDVLGGVKVDGDTITVDSDGVISVGIADTFVTDTELSSALDLKADSTELSALNAAKQEKLVAGEGITIDPESNTISVTAVIDAYTKAETNNLLNAKADTSDVTELSAKLNGLTLVTLTESQYASIEEKDANTLYIITE